jgi:hypothetical protein
MLSFVWRVAVCLVVIVGSVAAMEAVTADEGLRFLVPLLLAGATTGALWPVEFGLRADPNADRIIEPPDRRDATTRP